MRKLLFALLLALITAFLSIPSAAAATWYFSFTPADLYKVMVTGYSDNTVTNLDIPAFYYPSGDMKTAIADTLKAKAKAGVPGAAALANAVLVGTGLPVYFIKTRAFYNYSQMTGVHIPDSVTSIGTCAFFGCYNLATINIPDGLISLGEYCFGGCYHLERIYLPDSVTDFGENCFAGCSENLVIEASYGSAARLYALNNNIRFAEVSGRAAQEKDNLPDLSVGSLTIETPSSQLDVGEMIYFNSSIRNAGDSSTVIGFNIKWFVNGEQLGYGYHHEIAGESVVDNGNSQFSFRPDHAGKYLITFIVDCDNQIKESDEANNAMEMEVTIE